MKLDKKRIEIEMSKQEINATKLARLAGISRQGLSTMMTRCTCTPVTASKLARGLGVPVENLLEQEVK